MATESNPCFNVYYIGQPCPFPGDIVGDPYHINAAGSPPSYFAREDVQEALHAPSMPDWKLCANGIFYDNIDESPPSAANNGPLKTVIEKTNNVIIGHGTLDMVLMINGSLLALQNLTWNGEQGFSKPPQKDMVVPYYPQGIVAQSGNGTLGKWTESRGLTFCTVEMSGHQVPGFQPGVAYRHLEKLLGRIESLDDTANFTTSDLHFQPDEIQFEPPNEVHLAKRREQHARRA